MHVVLWWCISLRADESLFAKIGLKCPVWSPSGLAGAAASADMYHPKCYALQHLHRAQHRSPRKDLDLLNIKLFSHLDSFSPRNRLRPMTQHFLHICKHSSHTHAPLKWTALRPSREVISLGLQSLQSRPAENKTCFRLETYRQANVFFSKRLEFNRILQNLYLQNSTELSTIQYASVGLFTCMWQSTGQYFHRETCSTVVTVI